jgi:general secretion pathway protein C
MDDARLSDHLTLSLDRLAPLAVIAAVAWLLWQLLALTWLLLAGPTIPPATSPALPAAAPAFSGGTPALSVSKWHLFGNPGVALDLARLARQAPATSLKLELRGTFNEDGADVGYAIIADENGVHRRYRVGETVPGDAELIGIYRGRVLLRRAGVEESLSLPATQADQSGVAGGASVANRGRAAAAAGGAAAARRSAAPPAFINPNISVGMPSMESIRAATGTDVAELARQVSVFPVLENGRFAGVRLSVGRDSDLLDRAGLRPTDIITAVNGIPLDGPERIPQLTEALRDARQLTLSVRRDGGTLQLPVGL